MNRFLMHRNSTLNGRKCRAEVDISIIFNDDVLCQQFLKYHILVVTMMEFCRIQLVLDNGGFLIIFQIRKVLVCGPVLVKFNSGVHEMKKFCPIKDNHLLKVN